MVFCTHTATISFRARLETNVNTPDSQLLRPLTAWATFPLPSPIKTLQMHTLQTRSRHCPQSAATVSSLCSTAQHIQNPQLLQNSPTRTKSIDPRHSNSEMPSQHTHTHTIQSHLQHQSLALHPRRGSNALTRKQWVKQIPKLHHEQWRRASNLLLLLFLRRHSQVKVTFHLRTTLISSIRLPTAQQLVQPPQPIHPSLPQTAEFFVQIRWCRYNPTTTTTTTSPPAAAAAEWKPIWQLLSDSRNWILEFVFNALLQSPGVATKVRAIDDDTQNHHRIEHRNLMGSNNK